MCLGLVVLVPGDPSNAPIPFSDSKLPLARSAKETGSHIVLQWPSRGLERCLRKIGACDVDPPRRRLRRLPVLTKFPMVDSDSGSRGIRRHVGLEPSLIILATSLGNVR